MLAWRYSSRPDLASEAEMARPRAAVHRTVLVVDVEGFGDRRRTNPHQVGVRAGLYRALERAFGNADIPWDDCYREDRGDGMLILASPEVPKGVFVEALPHSLLEALREHNAASTAEQQIRLRMALHAGEVNYDDYGVTAAAINLAFRLLDARPLKTALAASPGTIAIITSSWFYDEVVRHSPGSAADTYRPIQVKVKETTTVGWICVPGGRPHPPREARPPSAEPSSHASADPFQLPRDIEDFTGRDRELRKLRDLFERDADKIKTLVITAIAGKGGVGKTTLAVRYAHQLHARFPDGQLYVNLRGVEVERLEPIDVLSEFLRNLGVRGSEIPPDIDARERLYRSLVAHRHILIILDNVANEAQVRPLLPGSSTCAVIITGRSRLAALEASHNLTLDVMEPDEALELLAKVSSPDRVAAEPESAAAIVQLCGYLPLAVRIAGSRLAARGSWRLVLQQ